MLIREGECHHCGECCKTVNITAVRDVTLKQHGNLEELQRYLSFRGIRVVGEDVDRNYLFYEMDVPCEQLSSDNKCQVHGTDNKPLLCMKYPEAPDDIPECGFRFRKETFA